MLCCQLSAATSFRTIRNRTMSPFRTFHNISARQLKKRADKCPRTSQSPSRHAKRLLSLTKSYVSRLRQQRAHESCASRPFTTSSNKSKQQTTAPLLKKRERPYLDRVHGRYRCRCGGDGGSGGAADNSAHRSRPHGQRCAIRGESATIITTNGTSAITIVT